MQVWIVSVVDDYEGELLIDSVYANPDLAHDRCDELVDEGEDAVVSNSYEVNE